MPLLIAVFLLFSLFRDRVEALQALRSYSPLSRKESHMLLERTRSMVHSTVFGSLTGLMFCTLGLPSALLWGAVMGLCAAISLVGTFVVWLPTPAF